MQKIKLRRSNHVRTLLYNYLLIKLVDGDTIDVDIDSSVFGLENKVRLGIDTPESRTRNLAEKALGLKAKERLGIVDRN